MQARIQQSIFLYCLWLTLTPLILFGQKAAPFPFRHIEYIGSKQGLNGTEVCWMKQDSRGFMWVITDVALNRYDGYNFQSWSYDAKDTNSISQNSYWGLAEDSYGTLWLPAVFSGGLYSFDLVHQRFTKYKHRQGNINSLPDNSVYSIIEDGDCIWVQTATTLSKFNVPHKSFINYKFNEPGDTEWIWDIAINNSLGSSSNKRNLYLIGTNNGNPCISYFNTAMGKITAHFYFPFKEAVSHLFTDASWRLNQQHKEIIWLGSIDEGIYGFNTVTGKFLKIPILRQCKSDWHNESFYCVLEDHGGNLWTLNDNNEIVYYNKTENKFYFLPYRRKHGGLRTFSSLLYEDKNHKIWITNADEILTIDTDQKDIFSFQHDPADPYSIAGNYVCGLNRVADKLFVGTSSGCQIFDRKSNHFYEPTFLKNINSNETWSISNDSKNNIWFIGRYGLTIYNPLTKKAVQIRKFKTDSGIIELHTNVGFLEDRKGRYWTSNGDYGLCCINPETFQVKTFSFYDPENVPASVGPIFIDSKGIMYVEGWESYFVTFNTNTDQYKIYKHNPSDPTSIRQGWAKGFIETNNGLIWFCSSGGGVGVFDPNTERFKAFTIEDGLSNDNAVSMVKDNMGRFWVSTYGGISCFTPPVDPFSENCKVIFRNYDVNDGLPSNAFNWASSFCDTDGTLFFGTRSAGLVYFHPDSLKDNIFIPPVYITGFSLSNKPVSVKDSNGVLKQSIEFTKQLSLNYWQNTFSFSFTALNYSHPDKNKYAYKLEGFDKDWIYTDASKRSATYTNLKPKSYIFKVKATNNDGKWNNTPTELKLIISPPFWQTAWFKIIIILVILSTAFLFYKYRLNQVLKLQKIRNKIAADLHDDIGSTLNSISIYSEVAKKDPIRREHALTMIGESSRKIIDSISDIVWTINPQNDSFDKIIFRMKSLTHNLLKAKKIDCTFKTNESINNMNLPMEIRKNFYLIFKEALNNLVKYSEATKASVFVTGEGRNITFIIRDNGIGFNSTSISIGNGINNMKRRAQEINADLNIESQPGNGTSVQLNLKL